MAFRDVMHDPTVQIPKHRDKLFYNTDGFVAPLSRQNLSVRFGQPNQKDDVELVQYFLKKIAENPSKFTHPFHPPREHLIMIVDGKFGEITRTWIEKFQIHIFRLGRPVLRDGVVDRIRNGHGNGSKGFVYTLSLLNVGFGQITGEERWDTWWKDADVPDLLRSKIRDPATFF